jgi:hypothetical protein
VRIPDHIGQDFNDVLREDMGLPPLAALAEEQQKQVAAIGEPR